MTQQQINKLLDVPDRTLRDWKRIDIEYTLF